MMMLHILIVVEAIGCCMATKALCNCFNARARYYMGRS